MDTIYFSFYPLNYLKLGNENATYLSIGDLSKYSVEEAEFVFYKVLIKETLSAVPSNPLLNGCWMFLH